MQQNALLLQRQAPSIVRLRVLSRSPRWPFLTSIQQRRWISASTPRRIERGQLLGTLNFPHLGGKHYFQVEIPQESEQNDVDAWLKALDTCLPAHLRQEEAVTTTHDNNVASSHRDISLLLIEARRIAALDVLEHLGIFQHRWAAVAWIVQTVAQRGLPADFWVGYPSHSPLTELKSGLSLDEYTVEITSTPTTLVQRPRLSLDTLTVTADPRFYDIRLQREALGQVWQSLGRLTVRAAEELDGSEKFMPHVLSSLATLHHHGIVPESVYKETPHQANGVVQRPPLLHMLSSQILTALSDAAWDEKQMQHAQSEQLKQRRVSPWNFRLEPTGVRFSTSSQHLRPEVWLELILWSCLHGGWVEEGAEILGRIQDTDHTETAPWSLISWQKILEAPQSGQEYSTTFGWRDAIDILEGARPESQPRPTSDDKALVVRTVSSELVTAYVDALVSKVHVGIGQRGTRIRQVLEHVKNWKGMLDRQDLGLGFATWDVIIQRFMESGSIWLERNPHLVIELLELVEPYGREEELVNTTPTSVGGTSLSPYFHGPSALPLNLFHRVLSSQSRMGNHEGTLSAMKALQDFTEQNQRRSIQQFFERLKEHRTTAAQDLASQDLLFDTRLAAAEYPSFYLQLPAHVLSRLLSSAEALDEPEFDKWIFDTSTVAEPLITDSMYKESGLAPALIRLASATQNRTMINNVMSYHSKLSRDLDRFIPTPVLTAFLETLIQRRNWGSVRTILKNMADDAIQDGDREQWHTQLLPVLSRELLRIEVESEKGTADPSHELVEGWQLFADMVGVCRTMKRIRTGVADTDLLLGHVALLASVDMQWSKLCSRLKIFPPRTFALRVSTPAFQIVLQGVLETRGLSAARKYWETWCHTSDFMRRTAVAQGGIFQVPRRRISRWERPHMQSRVLVETPAYMHGIEIVGRIYPTLATARTMLMVLRADRKRKDALDYDHEEMSSWLKAYFEALRYVKIRREDVLATLADALDM